jgi:hypothetical protein
MEEHNFAVQARADEDELNVDASVAARTALLVAEDDAPSGADHADDGTTLDMFDDDDAIADKDDETKKVDDDNDSPRQSTWVCARCTFRNARGRHCTACEERRLTREEEREYADAVTARANEDLSKDDGTAENEEFVSSSLKDDDENDAPATDPASRKRARTLGESTNTPGPYRTPDPKRRKSVPDLASKRTKDPTRRKLFEVEESTPPTTPPHYRQHAGILREHAARTYR